MADWSVDTEWSSAAANPAQPSGLTQASEEWMTGAWTPPETALQDAKAWAGGRNLEGETNGWSNDFYTRAYDQYSRFSDSAISSGKRSDFYNWLDTGKNPNATGVAIWNDSRKGIRRGDVFDNGVKKENIYDIYDENTADVMLGAFMFDGSRQAKMNKTQHPDRAWREAVQAEVDQNTEAAENVETAEAYQEDINRYQEEWEDWTGAAAGGVGVAGGAAAGAGIGTLVAGPVGTVVGGVLGAIGGGISGWMNRDQFSEVAARAKATADRARTEVGVAQSGFAYLEGAGRIAMFGLSPFQNTVQGIYDAQVGGQGDARSEWYEPKDPDQTHGWYEVANLGGALLDGLGTFSNAAAASAYIWSAGASAIGKTGATVTSDKWFNERTGRYEDLEGWDEYTGAAGTLGIEFLQVFQAGGLTRAGNNLRKAFGTEVQKGTETGASKGLFGTLDATQPVGVFDRAVDRVWATTRRKNDVLDRADPQMTQTLNGMKFFRTSEGEVIGARPTAQIVVPSEFTKWVPTGFQARQMRALDEGATGVDDLYRAALYMTDSLGPVGKALLNGYAESVEEFTQAYLEPRATGNAATWKELQTAALYGAAGGTGMGLGRLSRGPGNEQVQKERARYLHFRRTGEMVEEKDWDARWTKMTSRQRQLLSIATPEEEPEIKAMLEVMQSRQMMEDGSWSPVSVMALQDSRMNAHEKDTKNPRADNTFRLGGFTGSYIVMPNGDMEPVNQAHDAVMSAWDVVDVQRRRVIGFTTQRDELVKLMEEATQVEAAAVKSGVQDDIDAAKAETKALNARKADTEQQVEMAELLAGTLLEIYTRYRDETNPTEQAKLVAEMNRVLRRAWEGKIQTAQTLSPQQLKAIRRAVEFQTTRHPVIDEGSLSILRPQVSLGLSQQGSRGTVYTHQSLLKTIGGDHDGDTRVTLNFMYIPPDDLRALRMGKFAAPVDFRPTEEQIEANLGRRGEQRYVLQIDRPDGEVKFLEWFSRWSADSTSDQYKIVGKGITRLKETILDAYSKDRNPANAFDNLLVVTLLNQLEKDIRAGVPNAAIKFTEDLINSSANSYQDFQLTGERNNRMELPWLMQQFNTVWDQITQDISEYNYGIRKAQTVRKPRQVQDDENFLEGRAADRAVGLSYDLAELYGPEPVRSAQHVHYTSILNAAVDLHALKDNTLIPETARELARLYRELGSGQLQSDIDAVRHKDRVEKRILDWLSKIVGEVPEAANKPHMMLVLANTAVRDVTIADKGMIDVHDGEISLLQLLLRRSLEIEEGLAERAAPDDPIHAKIKRLKRLTYAQKEHSYSASEALMEVFSGMPMESLLGPDSIHFGENATLGQMKKILTGMSSRERKGRFKDLRSPTTGYIRLKDAATNEFKDPPYSKQVYLQGKMNGYSVVVDAMSAVVSNEFKNMAKTDGELIEKLENGFKEWQTVKAQWKENYATREWKASRTSGTREGQTPTDEEILTDLLYNGDRRISQLILELIPEAARQGAFQIGKDGRAYSAQWVKQMLLETNAQKAAAIYWLETKLEDWRVMGGTAVDPDEQEEGDENAAIGQVTYGRIKSRFLQSLYHVATDPTGLNLQAFMMNAYNAPSIQAIIDGINNNPAWIGNKEKLLALHDDVALFESDPKDVWTSNLPGSLQRDAIRSWGDRIGSYGRDAVQASVNKDVRNKTIRAMRSVLDTLPGKVLPERDESAPIELESGLIQDLGMQNLYLLQSMIQNARDYSDGIGPNARNQYWRATQEGLEQMHNKGAADRRIAPVGEALVLTDAYGVSQGVSREMSNSASVSLKDVLANPSGLAMGPVRIMMPDGRRVLDLDLSTVDGALRALADDRTYALAVAALGHTVRDVNIMNVGQIYLDTTDPTSFTKLLQDSTLVHVLWKSPRPNKEQAMRYIDMIESYLRKQAVGGTAEERKAAMFPIMSMIDDFLVNYDQSPFRTRANRDQLLDTLIIDVATAIRDLAKLEPDQRKSLQTTISKALHDRLYGGDALSRSQLSELEKELVNFSARAAAAEAWEERMTWVEDLLTDPSGVLEPAKRDALEKEHAELIDYMRRLNETEDLTSMLPDGEFRDFATLFNVFNIKSGVAPEAEQKKAIVDFLSDRSRLTSFLNNKTEPLIEKMWSIAYHTPMAVYDAERITDEEWDQLARLMVKLVLTESSVRAGSRMRLIPGDSDIRYYDKTGGYLLEPLFDEKILAAARSISIKAGDKQPKSEPDVSANILSTLFDENKIGVWNEFIPIESAKRRKALETSPTGLAIPAAGIDPVAYADMVGSAMVTTELPDESKHLSKAVITSTDAARFTVRDFLNLDPSMFTKLQNHFVKSVKITSTSRGFNSAFPDGDVTRLVASNNIQTTGVENSPYRVLHLDELQRTIDGWRDAFRMTDYVIEIEYVDVDKKPFNRKYANNIYFDGVGRASAANTSRGPIAAMVFALMGLSKIGQQEPLDAAARGGTAYKPYKPTKLETIEEIERTSGSVTEMMDRKARLMWGLEYDTGHLLTADLPALYKMVKMRHVFRIKDPLTGKSKLVWPEELIAKEAETGKPTNMAEVEVIGLSEDVSRALYGASGFEAINTALNEPILNLQDMDGFPSLDPERLKRLGLEHLGETVSAGETAFSQVLLPGRSYVSEIVGAQPKNLYKAREERWNLSMTKSLTVRATTSRPGTENFNPDTISRGGAQKFANMIAAEKHAPLFSRIGLPMSGLQDLTRTVIADSIAALLIKLKSSSEAVIWQHTFGGKYSLATGVLTQEVMSSGFKDMNGFDPTYGDSVVIDLKAALENHTSQEEAFRAVKAAITTYAERGLTIALGSEMGDQQFRGRVSLWLKEEAGLGYESFANSMHVFVPITSGRARSINERSLASMNTSVQVISPKYVTLGLLSEFFSTWASENNTGVDLQYDPQWKRVSAVIIPSAITITDADTDKEHMFNIPKGDQRDYVSKKVLDILRDPEQRKHVIKMAKGDTDSSEPPGTRPYRENKAIDPNTKRKTFDPGIRSIEDALDKLEETLASGKLPADPDDVLLMGDIIPVVDQQGNIFFQRLGFSMTSKYKMEKQLNSSPDGTVQQAMGLAISYPKIEDNQTVTPPITVTRTYPDPQRGYVMEGEWVLDPMAKVIWENAGFKAGATEIPSHWILPPPLANKQLNRTRITQFTSVKAPFSKGAMEGVVDNFSDAFVVFGMDFRPYLIDFFYGKDDTRSKAQIQSLWNDLSALLTMWANYDHQITDQEAAKMLDAGTVVVYAREMVNNMIGQLPINIPHVDLDSVSNGRVERDIALIFLATLAAPSVKLRDIASTSGLLTVENSMGDAKILRMPTILTDALDSSTLFPEVRKEMFDNINSNLPPEYELDEQWHFHAAIGLKGMGKNGKDAVLDVPAYLQYILPAPADQNPAGYVQSGIGRRQQQTQHVTNVLNEIGGGRVAIDPGLRINEKTGEVTFRKTATEKLYGDNQIMRFEQGSGQKFYDMLLKIKPNDDTYSPWTSDLMAQAVYKDMGAAKRSIYKQSVDTSDSTAWPTAVKIRVEGKQDEVLRILGLKKYGSSMRTELDYLVRMFLGRPGPSKDQEDYVGDIPGETYLQALELILTNVRDNLNPLHGGMVFVMDRHFVQTLYRAQLDRPLKDRWAPLVKDGAKKKESRKAGEWEEWIDGFLGHFRNSNEEFLSMFLTDVDGFLHTWQNARPGLGDLPVSYSKMRGLQLMNKDVNDAILSLDPGREAVLHDPIVLDSMKQTLDMLIGHDPVFNRLHAPGAYDSDLAAQFKKQQQWLASKKLAKQKRPKMKDYMADGTFYASSQAYESQLMKNITNLSLTVRLANPALWFSALMEVPARNMLEHITNQITGKSFNAGSQMGNRVGMQSSYTPKQAELLRNLAKQMGRRKEWLAVLHDEMTYNNLVEGAGEEAHKFSKGLEKLATKTARATSDPRYGMTGTAVAQRYIEAAMEYFALTGTSISVEQFVAQMSKDPLWLRSKYSEMEKMGLYSPHRAGMNRVAQVRSQKQTLLGKMMMSGPDWMTANDRSSVINFSGHLLRIPFMFTRFNINALMTISGLTAWDQAAAMFFDKRKKPAFLRKAGKPDTWDNTEIIETLDLQRTFLRSGVTYSMVMGLGLMAGGLGGDDEEERRRRRLMENLNLPHYLDPADSQNAFTNADAVYLDSIPFLGRFFKGAQFDDPATGEDERRAVVIPHWIMKQFSSPIIGISRFFENGDIREVGWGFHDAFSAIPNSILSLWDNADVTANLLAQQASTEANKGTAQGQANASSLLMQIVGVYERALFENAFANSLRNAGDKYDRNPYIIPGVDPETGEMLRQPGTGLPLPQKDALTSYVDANGDVKQAYMTRQGKDGELHQYAENNLTFALVASLFDGLGDSSFLRRNMAPRQQEILKPDITPAEFEAFVMSVYQGSGGQENLTQEEIIQQVKQEYQDADVWWEQSQVEDEAEARYNAQPGQVGALSIISPEAKEVLTLAGTDSVFTGLAKGTLQIGDPALENFAASQEMRDALAALWGERLVQEGIDLGLSFESANYRARRLWYGDNTNPDVPGLREIVYSRDIPKQNDLVYNQLNMTYAIGPDGMPWATPFPKMGILQSIGIPIPTEMLAPGPGLKLDPQGRIIDMTVGEGGINTGLSGLEKVVEVNDVKEPEDSPFEKGAAKNAGKSNGQYSRRPYRRYAGGGGGGGGGYTREMRALPGGAAARFDGLQMINTSSPLLRRADVYKQRIWSERGRLKQWQ